MIKNLFFSIVLILSSFVYGEISVTKYGPVHEAFVTKEQGEEVLQGIPQKPPVPLQETEKIDLKNGEIWVEGYWAWVEELADFVWVSGVQRKAPPGHKWISGQWRQFGWENVWVPGYWTNQEKDYKLSVAPPTPINELVPTPASSDYFWAQGYWEHSKDDQNYHWKKGRWEKFSSWVFVPGRYVTTGSSFIFIPPYWDFPLENRGQLFSNIKVPVEERSGTIFSSTQKVSNEELIQKLFGAYPQYSSLFQHFNHTHPHHFLKIGIEPTWWQWPSFWTLPFHDQMWLFWWWSHTTYPPPPWLTREIEEQITPASKDLLKWMKQMPTPMQVTNEGVLTFSQLIKAIRIIMKENISILPVDEKTRKRIFHEARGGGLPRSSWKIKSYDGLKKKVPSNKIPQKPDYTLPIDQYPSLPTRIQLPPYPNEEGKVAFLAYREKEIDVDYPPIFPPDAQFYDKQRMDSYNHYEEKNVRIRRKDGKRHPNEGQDGYFAFPEDHYPERPATGRRRDLITPPQKYFVVPEDPNQPSDIPTPQNEGQSPNQKKEEDKLMPPLQYRNTDRNYTSQPFVKPRPYRRHEGNRGPPPTTPLNMQHRNFIQLQPQDNL